jgi:hypothetical protein
MRKGADWLRPAPGLVYTLDPVLAHRSLTDRASENHTVDAGNDRVNGQWTG